jgi:hypothetical protein
MDISLLAPNILPEGLTAPNMTSARANPTEDKDLVNSEIPDQRFPTSEFTGIELLNNCIRIYEYKNLLRDNRLFRTETFTDSLVSMVLRLVSH